MSGRSRSTYISDYATSRHPIFVLVKVCLQDVMALFKSLLCALVLLAVVFRLSQENVTTYVLVVRGIAAGKKA